MQAICCSIVCIITYSSTSSALCSPFSRCTSPPCCSTRARAPSAQLHSHFHKCHSESPHAPNIALSANCRLTIIHSCTCASLAAAPNTRTCHPGSTRCAAANHLIVRPWPHLQQHSHQPQVSCVHKQSDPPCDPLLSLVPPRSAHMRIQAACPMRATLASRSDTVGRAAASRDKHGTISGRRRESRQAGGCSASGRSHAYCRVPAAQPFTSSKLDITVLLPFATASNAITPAQQWSGVHISSGCMQALRHGKGENVRSNVDQ